MANSRTLTMFRRHAKAGQAVVACQRRRRHRVDTGWTVLVSSRHVSVHGSVLNISETGILFSAKARLHRGESVVLDISFRSHRFFRCRARIAWEGKDAFQSWQYGGAFLNISVRDSDMLLESIDELRRARRGGQDPYGLSAERDRLSQIRPRYHSESVYNFAPEEAEAETA